MKDFKFKKAYGQNFINNHNIIKNIVDKSNILPNSLVIEIGPGSGSLTKELAKQAKEVLAYEIDTSLEDILDEELIDYHNISIIFDDFLKRDIREDIKDYQYDNIYVVANIPYYITTPIIEKLINSNINFKQITLMVQKEVGDRFCSHPGSREYGSITVYLNYYFDVKKLFVVKKEFFTPKPKIDSVIISLTKKEKLKVNNEDHLLKLIRDAFQYKRKNIRNNLKKYNLKMIEEVLLKHHFDLTTRAEELPMEIFVELSNQLTK